MEDIVPTPIDSAATPEIKREEYLTMAQAARVSGYQQDYLGQMARQGKLKAIKSGHHWITTRSAVESLTLAHRKIKALTGSAPTAEIMSEIKPEITNSIPEPAPEIIPPVALLDPTRVHSMHVSVSEEDLPHAPTIAINI